MFLSLLGTTWEIGPKSMKKRTKFHILLKSTITSKHHEQDSESDSGKIRQEWPAVKLLQSCKGLFC
jgi:hypothetical protein